jgi:RNA polymerase sigma-70 factor (ECF subfamily)
MTDTSAVPLPAVHGKTGVAIAGNSEYSKTAESDAIIWEGKLKTFIQVSEQCRAELLWQAQRIINNREEAEDIVQESLLKALRNLSHFRGESQMYTWLRVIVRNTAIEWLRSRKGRVCLPLESVSKDNQRVVFEIPDPGRNPVQCYERREMGNILLSKINKLNSVCKRAIQMCFFEGLSYLEAANALGVNVITVKSRIFHGTQMLKRSVCLRAGEQDDLSRSMELAY